MKRLNYIIVMLLILICAIPCQQVFAFTDYTEESNYVYDQTAYPIRIPTAYEYKKMISLKNITGYEDINVTNPIDMFVKDNGEFFIVESELGAILCFDKNQKLINVLKEFTLQDGSTTTLKKPEGVFVTKEDKFYIADTENSRIVVCDRKGKVSMIVEKPDSLLGTNLDAFLPVKVVVDSVGRISVSARNINSGIMQFTQEGVFTGYTGAPKVSVDAFTKLLRQFSTAQQKAQMQNYVPTEYSNIKIDQKNFIWGTISSLSTQAVAGVIQSQDLSGSVTPIKKLNTMGVDVLNRKGLFAPIGELFFIDQASKILDVGLGPNNIYSMLDSVNGRIFTYNNNGILLYVFGNKGTRKGNMQTPMAIDYIGNEIYVLDSGLCQVIVYEPTSYAKLLIDAEQYYEKGDYELANQKWEIVAQRNANFEYAYIGLGNAKYSSQQYKDAMKYYEYANDSTNYSKAKEKLRKENAQKIFPIIFISVLSLLFIYLVVVIFSKVKRYARGEVSKSIKGEDD